MRKSAHDIVQQYEERIVGFCQRLVRVPSLSGHEDEVARLVAEEMQSLDYDDVTVDIAGNVIGCVGSSRPGNRILYNGHMDVVSAGDPKRWLYPPFSATIADGCIWGRGTCDMKAGLAAQIYAVGLLQALGLAHAGDLMVSAAVNEEVGGLGSKVMSEQLSADVAVIGEASNNMLMRGHRGRFEIVVTFVGIPAHASVPQQGVNPHYAMSRFLLALGKLPMRSDSVLVASSVSPTLIHVPGKNANVIPESVSVHLDWRPVPADDLAGVLSRLRTLASDCLDEGGSFDASVHHEELETYSGYRAEQPAVLQGFLEEEEGVIISKARAALEAQLGREVNVGVWHFATDGSHFAAKGVPCIGFGPGEPEQAHMFDEHISIAALLQATEGNMALALALV